MARKKVRCKGTCGRMVIPHTRGRCRPCYDEIRPKKKCWGCKKMALIHGGGLCHPCYGKRSKIICRGCKEEKIECSGGYCNACYITLRPEVVCIVCKELCAHLARQMCGRCYQAWWQRTAKECVSCGNKALLKESGRCRKCEAEWKNEANRQSVSSTTATSLQVASSGQQGCPR